MQYDVACIPAQPPGPGGTGLQCDADTSHQRSAGMATDDIDLALEGIAAKIQELVERKSLQLD
eukprot:6734078-Pyramimonas_sp.AAC.1